VQQRLRPLHTCSPSRTGLTWPGIACAACAARASAVQDVPKQPPAARCLQAGGMGVAAAGSGAAFLDT